MNASATMRASYVRTTRLSYVQPRPRPISIPDSVKEFEPRPARDEKLQDFQAVDYVEHRERCDAERKASCISFDVMLNADSDQAYIDNRYLEGAESLISFDQDYSVRQTLKKMVTVFPYRDPTWLVAVVFAFGSLDLVINGFFDLLPRTLPATTFKNEIDVGIPATVLIGSIFFFAASVFDTFGALNADTGTIDATKKDLEAGTPKIRYRPALLGSPEFKWIPSRTKFFDLAMTNLAFQGGLLVLIGGVIFMFAGIVDFPQVISVESPYGRLIVAGPQIVHGFLFFIANAMLAISEQEKWYRPKFFDADWCGAFLNTVGGFAFMMAGFFLFTGDELNAAFAALVGSFWFLGGSILRWYLVMELW